MYLKGGTLFIKDFEDFNLTSLTADNPKSPEVILSDELAECLFVNPSDLIDSKAYKQIAIALKYADCKIVVYPELRAIPETSDVLEYAIKGLEHTYILKFENKYITETNNRMSIRIDA